MARLRPGLTSFHGDLEPAFHELVTATGNGNNPIFAYFDHAIADADTESLNNPT